MQLEGLADRSIPSPLSWVSDRRGHPRAQRKLCRRHTSPLRDNLLFLLAAHGWYHSSYLSIFCRIRPLWSTWLCIRYLIYSHFSYLLIFCAVKRHKRNLRGQRSSIRSSIFAENPTTGHKLNCHEPNMSGTTLFFNCITFNVFFIRQMADNIKLQCFRLRFRRSSVNQNTQNLQVMVSCYSTSSYFSPLYLCNIVVKKHKLVVVSFARHSYLWWDAPPAPCFWKCDFFKHFYV